MLIDRTRPSWTFEFYKQNISPNTEHTPETYASFQLVPDEVPQDARTEGKGAVFVVSAATRRAIPNIERGTKLRITAINGNWVWAVPATYVERFWE
ncbi:hypothetical protein ACOTHJ_16050 [Achromobacter xylosoxidans]